MNKKILALSICVAIIFALAGAGTYAWFTSQAASNNNTFQTGTLILGGEIDGKDVNEKFATVSFNNIEPGEPSIKLETTTLKNVGSLPFYLYRITADNFVDNTDNEVNDLILNEVLTINITIDGDKVYEGKLSQLVEENGGYFDPIYGIQPHETKDMKINISMDENAGNNYQGLSMSCDFTVYARQNEHPIPGENGDENIGETDIFSVVAYNDDNYVNFDWDWIPNDKYYEYYKIEIKHETGDVTTGIEEERLWFFINFYDEEITSLDDISKDDIDVDWDKDIVKIKKSAFPEDWEGFEYKISGMQNLKPLDYLPWQYWSLDR